MKYVVFRKIRGPSTCESPYCSENCYDILEMRDLSFANKRDAEERKANIIIMEGIINKDWFPVIKKII